MEKVKHTPGPWHIVSKVDVADGDGYHVCSVPTSNKTQEERIENARLIAAAPDLLLALIDAMYQHDHKHLTPDEHWYHKAKRAIAKVKGE